MIVPAQFLGSFQSLPDTGSAGDVVVVDGQLYAYLDADATWSPLCTGDITLLSDEQPKKIVPRFCETCGANLKGMTKCSYCGNDYST